MNRAYQSPQAEGSRTAAAVGRGPWVWRFGVVGSCLDTARMLAARGWLAPWESVQAVSQTAGRGQLRRQWRSPPGNLYAALRLPCAPPFDGSAAAPAMGVLAARALQTMGWPVRLKWPNDLVLDGADGTPRKVAGVLLEERGGVLLAGMGLNVAWAPETAELRADAALEATCLAAAAAGRENKGASRHIPTAEALWQHLVMCLYSAYNSGHSFSEQWRDGLEDMLLWRGLMVELCDDGRVTRGRLEGLGASGGVCLDTGGRVEEFFCGSLRRGG